MGPGVSQEAGETQDGLHVWEDHFLPEIIDPVTHEVLPDGEEGELVFTSLTKQAMPVVRYRTRDLTRLLPGTAYPAFRRMAKVTGRTDDMMIVRGVNVFPTQVEEQILTIEGLAPHYLCVLTRPGQPRRADRPGRGRDRAGRRTGRRAGRPARGPDQAAGRRDRAGRGAGAARAGAVARQGEADQRPARVRQIVGQLGRPAGELGRALLEERRDALLAVADRGVEHRQRVGEVRLERVGGGAVAVDQLPGQPERDRGAVDHERPGQLERRGQQVVRLVHGPDQPAGERLLGGQDLGGVDPLQRLLDADDPGQEPGRRGLGHDAEPAEDEADPRLASRPAAGPSPGSSWRRCRRRRR